MILSSLRNTTNGEKHTSIKIILENTQHRRKEMLNTKTTKSLKIYARMGVDSKSIRPIYDIVMKNEDIPILHRLPFALMLANCFMNGAYPPGFRKGNSYELWRFFKGRNSGPIYSPERAKKCLLNPNNSDKIILSYKSTKPTTLKRWSQAIVRVNEAFDPTNECPV